jgi:oligo-1,6-glucosidase
MQWDATPHAGFTSGTPWIAVNPNFVEINAEGALADEGSVFHYYRRLIALRHDERLVARGDFTMLLAGDPVVYAFTRGLADEELLVLGNFSSEPVTVDVPSAADWAASELLIANYPPYDDAPALVLRPWEARVYRRQAAGNARSGAGFPESESSG